MYYLHTDRPADAKRKIDKLFELTSDQTAFYFASIASLLLGDREKAYEYIGESLRRGFSRELIMSDPDLELLRATGDFEAHIAAYQ